MTRVWRVRDAHRKHQQAQPTATGAEENGKTGDSAQQEEQQTLGRKLADEARSLRSQSLANRDLTTSHAREALPIAW